jgi:3-methyladenine DNA glycosylase/8-oxoguanine DNA glycosylase
MVQAGEGVSVSTCESSEGELTTTESEEVVNKVRWMLGLEQDFAPFYKAVRNVPQMAHVERCAKGRFLRCPTVFEDIIKTILSTNTSWGGTVRMTKNLVTAFGEPYRGGGGSLAACKYAFPTPTALAETDEVMLREQARLGYRAPYVLELARAVDSGELNLEGLQTALEPGVELRQRLVAIKGVGSYAAANMLMLLGHHEFIPVDSTAKAAVSKAWYDGQPVGQDEVEDAFERWGQWQGLVYWFWDWS